MTVHEMRVIYPGYREKERILEQQRIDNEIKDANIKRAGCGLITEPALTSDPERRVTDG